MSGLFEVPDTYYCCANCEEQGERRKKASVHRSTRATLRERNAGNLTSALPPDLAREVANAQAYRHQQSQPPQSANPADPASGLYTVAGAYGPQHVYIPSSELPPGVPHLTPRQTYNTRSQSFQDTQRTYLPPTSYTQSTALRSAAMPPGTAYYSAPMDVPNIQARAPVEDLQAADLLLNLRRDPDPVYQQGTRRPRKPSSSPAASNTSSPGPGTSSRPTRSKQPAKKHKKR